MAKQSKGRKFDRNRRRNPSSGLQAMRTARNKRLRIEKAIKLHGAKSVGHVCPKHPDVPPPQERVMFTHLVPNYAARGRPIFCYVKGVCVDVRFV